MILTANGFAVVKYNGLFPSLSYLLFLQHLTLLMALLTAPSQNSSLDTYHPLCSLGLCYSFLVFLSDFSWTLCLLHLGLSRFLSIRVVYNLPPIFKGHPYPLQASDIFYFLGASLSIPSIRYFSIFWQFPSLFNHSLQLQKWISNCPQCILTCKPYRFNLSRIELISLFIFSFLPCTPGLTVLSMATGVIFFF